MLHGRIFFAFALLLFAPLSGGHDNIAKSLARLVLDAADYKGTYADLVEFEKLWLQEDSTSSLQPKVEAPGIGGDEGPKVQTTSGLVEGISETGAHAFYEIPYAEPPVEELRFQPPKPIETPKNINGKKNDHLQCLQFETACVGPNPLCNRIEMDEDCLVLNVFVPSHINLTDPENPPSDRLPVMFYIHGGSFLNGAGTRDSLDGKELAQVTNTVIVTINYRLGALGFLVHKEQGYSDIGGNQGLKDQQLALQWVQDNIANFGGSKSKVTLFGNSAGAQSVMFHTLSEVSKPMYSGAIQQSNPAVFSYQTPQESLDITNRLLTALRCNKTLTERECLMKSEATVIANRRFAVMFRSLLNGDTMGLIEPHRPVIDGEEFTDNPLHLYRDGKWNSDKNMIIGVNTQELEDIQYYLPPNLSYNKGLFAAVNYVIFGIGTTDVVVTKYSDTYPPKEDENWMVTFGVEMTHLYFICPSRAMARYASQTVTGAANVYFYANAHPVLDYSCESRNNESEGCYYSTHADEVRFVFRTRSSPSEDDQSVEDHFSTYWGSFARTGDPSNNLETPLEDFTDWPQYTSEFASRIPAADKKLPGSMAYYSKIIPFLIERMDDRDSSADLASEPWQNIRIKAQAELEGEYEEDICEFWDSIGYYMDPIPLPTTTTTTKQTTTTKSIVSTTSGAEKMTFWSPILMSFIYTFLSFLHHV